jgi:arylsulfatase A-like enzyme
MKKLWNCLNSMGSTFLLFILSMPGFGQDKRPNILFIMSDDHAYQAISAYDTTLTRTPQIDRIAREGMLFTNACVTNSICAPSRAVILTGKHSHLNGKIDNKAPFDTNQLTFPQLLRQNGYQTSLFGKLHFGNSPKGFDEFKILRGQGEYYNPQFITKSQGKVQVPGYATDIITGITLDWLKQKRDPQKPFLCMYLHKAPHREWLPAPRHYKKYLLKNFPLPATLFDAYENRGTAAKTAEMNLLKHLNWAGDSKIPPHELKKLGIKETSDWGEKAYLDNMGRMDSVQVAEWHKAYTPMVEAFKKQYPSMTERDLMIWRYQRYMQDYLACIESVDEGVGKVLDYLEKEGLAENTLVVYTSDQGFYLGEHGWFDKRFMYNESFRTPLLIRWPGKVKPGSVNHQMVQNLDFAQTFLEMAGIKAPANMQGQSLVPLLKGDTAGFRKEAYFHFYEYPGVHQVKRHYGVANRDYKLIHFYNDVDEWELYDRKKDPSEIRNVFADPAYASVVKSMKELLDATRKKYKDSAELDRQFIELDKKWIQNPDNSEKEIH